MSEFDPKALYPYQPIIDRTPIKWPNDARVAVWIVPNIEHFHLNRFNNPPDVRNYARRDYGNRVGIWRMMEVMQKHGARGTVALNSEVYEHYPRIIEKAAELGWEFMGHGTTNSITFSGLDRQVEERIIAHAKGVIESLGRRMKGWLGPGLEETWNTLDLLKKYEVQYVADWVHDDLPVRMSNGLYSIPYTVELNDMPLFIMPSVSTAEFQRRICDAFDVLYEEGAKQPRVMCISLHPFLIGAPHRIKYFDRALEYVAAQKNVWFATGSEIIQAFREQEPSTVPAR